MRRVIEQDGVREGRLVRCGGYTLLELLVASVLVAVLMAAAWNLMTMYSSFLVAGRSQAAEQQLVRSLMDLFAADLRAAAFVESAGVDVATGPEGDTRAAVEGEAAAPANSTALDSHPSSGLTRTDSQAGAYEFVEAAAPLPERSFFGDEVSLTLLVTRRSPDFRSDSGEADEVGSISRGGLTGGSAAGGPRGIDGGVPVQPQAGEWVQVFYRFEPPRMIRPEEERLAPGLHRFEVPAEFLGLLAQQAGRLATEEAASAGPVGDEGAVDLSLLFELLREQGVRGLRHEHVPEVVACRFEYLGPSGWARPGVAGDPLRDVPRAVRVRIKLLSLGEHAELMALLGSEAEDEAAGGARDEAAVEVANRTAGMEGGAEVFAAFQPRLYERTILLDSGRNVRTPDGDVPGGAGAAGSGSLFAGGRR